MRDDGSKLRSSFSRWRHAVGLLNDCWDFVGFVVGLEQRLKLSFGSALQTVMLDKVGDRVDLKVAKSVSVV